MKINEFEKYTTKYQQYIIKRFSETVSKAKNDYDLWRTDTINFNCK